MEPMTLRICHLYPTLLSIAGDRRQPHGHPAALRVARSGYRGYRSGGRRSAPTLLSSM